MKTIMLAISFVFALASLALAESVTLAWDANPAAEHVTRYRLDYGPTPELGKSVETPAPQVTVPDLSPGTWHFSVVAINSRGLVSPASEALSYVVLVPPTAPAKLRVVEIQTSSNLTDWKTIAMIPQDPAAKPAEFVRARISTLEAP